MGNENSKDKNETSPEKHENGSVNGLSANIISNGLEIDVNSETIVKKNGGPISSNLAKETTVPDSEIVESDCKPADAPVISNIPLTTVQEVVEEVMRGQSKEVKVNLFGKLFKKKAARPADVKSVQEKKTSNEDQTDVSLPAADPQPELGSSGEEAAMVIAEHQADFEKATQTDRKTEAHISTQTGDDDGDDKDDDTTTITEGPMEDAATEEEALNESAVNITEEVVKEPANEEPLDNQTAGIIIEEVIFMKNNVYENMVFRADLMEVTDTYENLKKPEITAEPESNPNKSFIQDEIVAEENNTEETVLLEVSSSLPKVVADCVKAVFAAVSTSAEFAAVNTSDPSVDVFTGYNGEGAGDMSADIVLIETAEPEYNAVTPEAGEANGVPSLDEAPVTVVMETISEVVCEEPNPTPAYQDMPVEELEKILVTVESAHKGVSVEDVPAVSEEFIPAEAPSNELIAIEELLEDSLNSPDDKVKPESIHDVITTDENADVGLETTEAEPSSVIEDDTDEIPETAIDALCLEFELFAITPPEPAVNKGFPVEEEVITATTFVPLSGEQEASCAIPVESIAATAQHSNEMQAVREGIEEETTVQESSTGEEVEEPVGKKNEVAEDVLAPKQNPVISDEHVEEKPSPCEEDATCATLEKILDSVVKAISEKLEVTENIGEETADEQADVPRMDATGEFEPCNSVQEEVVEGNITPVDVLLEDADKVTAAHSVVKEQTDSNPVISEEPLKESVSLLERQPKTEVLTVIIETAEDEVTQEMDRGVSDVLAAIEEISEDSQIATSDEPVAECVKDALETIAEKIIMEYIAAECNLVTSEEVARETIAEGETEEKERD